MEKKKLYFTEDYKKADELGLTELNRWEDGIEHHPTSDRLVRFMKEHDINDYNDSMCIKVGGDGDNGEQLMYLMDPFFEMLDKQKQFLCFWVGDGGDRESYNTYHSKLILASNKDEALDKYVILSGFDQSDKGYYDAIEMKVL